jgi:D-inositol-3-phosphate glycosyltransferase
MKVAMVSEHASPLAVLGGVDAGGQNVHVAALAEALAGRGHQVTVYTRRDSPRLVERTCLVPGVLVEHLDAGPPCEVAKDDLLPYVPAMARDLAQRLADDPPDVVHAHFWMSGLASLAAASPLDIPVVQTFHALGAVKRRFQHDLDTSPATRIGHEQTLAVLADRVIASCADEMKELIRLGGDASRIDIVPSGVDLSLFTPEGVVAPRTQRHRLLVVSRLVPRKGVDDAIRSVARLADTELLIAGGPDPKQLVSDPEARRLSELAAELGVAERVQLLGRVSHSDLPALIRSADVMVCLPWYEPFGIVPLEAMACGVPVVGTAVGGLLDTVADGSTGLLVQPRDPRAATRAIRRLLSDARLRRRLGASGRRQVAGFGWPAIAERTERTYLCATGDVADGVGAVTAAVGHA